MRLIDADKLRIKCHIVNDLQPDKFVVSRMMVSGEAIDAEPTVKVIPIEWIKKQIENPPYSHSWELGERWKGEYDTCLMVLLEDWEKENVV